MEGCRFESYLRSQSINPLQISHSSPISSLWGILSVSYLDLGQLCSPASQSPVVSHSLNPLSLLRGLKGICYFPACPAHKRDIKNGDQETTTTLRLDRSCRNPIGVARADAGPFAAGLSLYLAAQSAQRITKTRSLFS